MNKQPPREMEWNQDGLLPGVKEKAYIVRRGTPKFPSYHSSNHKQVRQANIVAKVYAIIEEESEGEELKLRIGALNALTQRYVGKRASWGFLINDPKKRMEYWVKDVAMKDEQIVEMAIAFEKFCESEIKEC